MDIQYLTHWMKRLEDEYGEYVKVVFYTDNSGRIEYPDKTDSENKKVLVSFRNMEDLTQFMLEYMDREDIANPNR